MVATQNTQLEPHVDDIIKNWVTDHVNQVSDGINAQFAQVTSSLGDVLTQLQYLVTYVNRLKEGRGKDTSRFSRLGKLEFPKFSGDDFSDGINAQFAQVTSSLGDVLTQLQYLVTYVNRLKEGRGKDTSRFSRLGKLEFPKFSGDDVQGWLYRVKQFFAVDNIHEGDKVKIASIHLHDKALSWHQQFVKLQGENVVWIVYEEDILKRFGPINEDPMAELKNLRYGSNMKDYQSQFEQLLTQVDVTESQSVSLFIVGLPANIKMTVRMFKPRTLADAMSLANFQEASLAVVKSRTTPLLPTPKTTLPYYANRNVNYPNRTTTLAILAPTNQVVAKHPAITEAPPRKQLSQKELAEKRAKNLCFYCDQRYTPGHKCSGHMYALEVSPGEEVGDSVENEFEQVGNAEIVDEGHELMMSECYPCNTPKNVSQRKYVRGRYFIIYSARYKRTTSKCVV
ncbi:retrovirus-related pol polyprotein from transposon TNT 1-94 [Tanacetum coccineum]